MYKIYADSTLIYDSTVEDYKIGKGEISLEIEKAGSFVFSMYPDNPYYDGIVKMKTLITVYRDDEIIFRGRALKTEDGFYNDRVVTCEGELGFLLDSIIRPYTFNGTPRELFTKFITEHNAQVDEVKQFVIGDITVVDNNDYIARSNINYQDPWTNIKDHLIGDTLGGYLFVTHNSNGQAVINYYADFPDTASQTIEFGENLKDYTKIANAEDIATVLIPLGAKLKDEDDNDTDERLTIESVNSGIDYIEDAAGISLYGRIVKSEIWDDVTIAARLLTKGRQRLNELINQNITIDLSAIDLHLLDRSIESFHYGEYIRIVSIPHSLNIVMLCKKQTINLLRPDNDSLSLGYTYATLTETSAAANKGTVNIYARVSSIVTSVNNAITEINVIKGDTETNTDDISIANSDIEAIALIVDDNAENISTLQEAVDTLTTNLGETDTKATNALSRADTAIRDSSAAVNTANAASQTAGSFASRISALENLGLFVGDDGYIYQNYEED